MIYTDALSNSLQRVMAVFYIYTLINGLIMIEKLEASCLYTESTLGELKLYSIDKKNVDNRNSPEESIA